jgi:hypothetical protein
MSDDVFKFLQGEGPLDGAWFGDKPAGERGDFWWRKHLSAEVERLTQERDQLIERCAVAAWMHHMDTARKHGVSPAVHQDYCAASAIRALKESPHPR